MGREKVLDRNSLWDVDEKCDEDEVIYFLGIHYNIFVYWPTGIRIILN